MAGNERTKVQKHVWVTAVPGKGLGVGSFKRLIRDTMGPKSDIHVHINWKTPRELSSQEASTLGHDMFIEAVLGEKPMLITGSGAVIGKSGITAELRSLRKAALEAKR